MGEYNKLKEDLAGLVKSRGSVSAEELVEWARRVDLSELTLYILVQDLLETGDFRAEGGQRVIEPVLHIEVPARLVYARVAEAPVRPAVPVKPAAPRRARKPRRTASSTGLLRFLESEGGAGAEASVKEGEVGGAGGGERGVAAERQAPEAPRGVPQPAGAAAQQAPSQAHSEALAELESLSKDEDFAKVLKYLGRYWSVGRLRFLSDMLSEGIDVKKALAILAELRKRGLVELAEDDVINAKKELREFYRRSRGSTSIYDLFTP